MNIKKLYQRINLQEQVIKQQELYLKKLNSRRTLLFALTTIGWAIAIAFVTAFFTL
jgi:hypothetical protein